ncbi:GtrA family protein [Nocardioides sp. URHA0020]|uniref:GtrA family protein n=1 Tax=Nocardioides sp. URHA0020 TaxID=1380392 RepID=UPI000687057C|nr:GtrA family protein [Nocardioides sp. URHA0020]
MRVLIPAYQPTDLLTGLVRGLLEARPGADVLIVDDGSDLARQEVFAACQRLGASVLRLPTNRGKGYALRAGFRHLDALRATGPVVTADADGQHAVTDILAVADSVDTAVGAAPHLVLGERQFDTDVPLRSRFGNAVTRLMFRAATGLRLRDTQTGLRAFPATMLPWLTTVRGDRYEYELVMLLQAARHGIPIRSEAIRTVYLDEANTSSHFRPVADSVRIYAPLLIFMATSLTAFIVDTGALLVVYAALGALLPAVVVARLVSGALNFAMNRHLVFPGGSPSRPRRAAVRYAVLAAALLLANYLLLSTLVAAGIAILPAKIATEAVLVSLGYVAQARFVFRVPSRFPQDSAHPLESAASLATVDPTSRAGDPRR